MDDPGSANSTLTQLQSVWSTILSILGALIVWNGRRLIKEVDDKASRSELLAHKDDLDAHKEDLEEHKREVKRDFDRLFDLQQQQHQHNTERLDRILTEVSKGRGRMT